MADRVSEPLSPDKGMAENNLSRIDFQADNDTYVSPEQQEKFVRKLSRHQQGNVKLVKIPGTKHEIFNSGAEVLAIYWTKILLEC